jgi:hypothetical protein
MQIVGDFSPPVIPPEIQHTSGTLFPATFWHFRWLQRLPTDRPSGGLESLAVKQVDRDHLSISEVYGVNLATTPRHRLAAIRRLSQRV